MPAGCIRSLLDLQCGVASALPVHDGANDRAFPANDNLVERRVQQEDLCPEFSQALLAAFADYALKGETL